MSSTLKPGQELHSDSIIYRIESVLGQGSFGITYKAKAFAVIKGRFGEELVETNTIKAIKEFFMKEVNNRDASGSITGMSEGSLSYNYAQKFKKEAENLAGMDHPNIVKVIDLVSANNTFYYVMDYIEGENLNDYLKHHKMNVQEATDTIMEVAKALKYMHEEKNMLHLDLKPGNIMRRKSDGHIFLIDFGLSKHYSDEGQPDTSTTIGLGTEGYAPLEQGKRASAQNSFRPTIDVYALGGTLFKMLTGETPPPASDILEDEELLENIMNKHGVSLHLQKTIIEAMMPSAKRRTASVAEFLSSVSQFTGDLEEMTRSDETADYVIDNQDEETIITRNHVSVNTISNNIREQEMFIDLGLSVKWASRNLGGDDITNSGKFLKGIILNNPNEWGKIPMNFGGTLNDPVTNAMGESYRLPSKLEFKELIDNCKWSWTNIDGVHGYFVTARNGNRIFLPSAGGYWSCTKGESKDFQCVYYLFINSYDIDLIYNVYTTLRCIRPVQPI